MEAQLRIGHSQALADFWQQQQQQQQHQQLAKDHDTCTLYAHARGRCFNVTFATRPPAVASLVFRNFYAASFRLVQLNLDGSSTVILDEYSLMKHAHCEDDAQSWHVIHLDQGCVKPDVMRLESLQFYIFQPSTVFETWELQHIKLYECHRKNDTSGLPQATEMDHTATTAPKLQAATGTLSAREPSIHQLSRRLSRSSLLIVDARDVREKAAQALTLVHQLRQLVHHHAACSP